MPDVVVIGAGVSGLTCAWKLQRAGLDVSVVEAGSFPGGVIASHEIDGCLVESGPNTILPTPGTLDILRDVGVSPELVSAPLRAPRFIYLRGRLRKAPWVLSVPGILRAIAEPLIPRFPKAREESVREFITRRFGSEVHDRLVAPFVGGIYAGDTGSLGVEAAFPGLVQFEERYRSVILGAIRSGRAAPRGALSSFRNGMRTLPEYLSKDLKVRYNQTPVKIDSGRVELVGESIRAPALVLAVPAWRAAGLLATRNKRLSGLLDSVYYAPLIVAATTLDETALPRPLDGFGFLVPRGEGMRLLGTLFSSVLFPGRAPLGSQLLTSFLGGVQDAEITQCSDDRVWETVRSELFSILRLRAHPKPVRLYRYRRGIPQYPVGHSVWRKRVEAYLEETPGLYLTGNYLDGVSVPATMEHGRRTADRIVEYLRRAG